VLRTHGELRICGNAGDLNKNVVILSGYSRDLHRTRLAEGRKLTPGSTFTCWLLITFIPPPLPVYGSPEGILQYNQPCLISLQVQRKIRPAGCPLSLRDIF